MLKWQSERIKLVFLRECARRKNGWFLSVLIFLCCIVIPSVATAQETVKIGVLANVGDVKAQENWQALADYLGQAIPDRQFAIQPIKFSDLYQAMEKKQFDFVIANTAQYVEMEALYGITRIATLRNLGPGGSYTHFGGVIFTRATEKSIDNLADLATHRVMAVDATSLGGWLCALREMHAAGIEPAKFSSLTYAGNHEGVVNAVMAGQADVGIVRTDTLERMQRDGRVDLQQIKIINQRTDASFPFLHSTRLYPEWPFAKSQHTEEELGRRVAIALLNMPADSAAATLANSAGWTIPDDYSSVHELFRELKLGPYRDLGKFNLWDVLSKYWPVFLLVVLLLVVLAVATVLVMRANRRQKIVLEELEEEKKTVELTLEEMHAIHDELTLTHNHLEKSNGLLMESVNYARKIQEALLPSPEALSDKMDEVAVCWQPLHVVSGDYYWMQEVDGRCVIVVGDCTGHGVPGAFLTMVFATALEQILREESSLHPAAMLSTIDRIVRKRLRQEHSNSPADDGLEAAICIFDRRTATMEYAGAGISLLAIPVSGSWQEFKADRMALGYGSLRPKSPFTSYHLHVEPGTSYYLFTDGAPDHIGGSPCRLFGRKRLTETIAQQRHLPLAQQLEEIREQLDSYRGKQLRRDDMTIIAFRPLGVEKIERQFDKN